MRRPTAPDDEDMDGTLCESCPNRLFRLDEIADHADSLADAEGVTA